MADGHDEHRVVTALFADVAGSTALSERLDPEEAKLIIGEAIGRAIRSVEAYGGSVNNLLGDGLLALFGAPVAHEDDPERAVRAGLDIVAAMRDYGEEVRRGWGIDGFAMRVGIHSGDVVVGQVGAGGRVEYGVVGDTVNSTARLQAAAEPNAVLVSEQTKRQVAQRFEWGEPRSLQLKGKADAFVAYPVVALREISGQAASPDLAGPMVGRDSELSSALELLQRLAAGRGGVLYIVGEPGIGKSRLAAELRQRAIGQEHCLWMEGRCVSYGESLPYWPYRDLLRNWLEVSATEAELRVRVKLRRKTDETFKANGNEFYPYLATILGLQLEPEAAAQLQPLSPESVQYRTFEVFSELLQRISETQPVVISLDDLHWADPTSLALTERLLGLTEHSPILLAISQRPETDHPSWLLKEKAAREYRHLFRELALQPLEHESEGVLLGSLAGGRKLPPAVSDRLLAYAEGNPFYLEQLLRSLIDRGTLVPENGHWKVKAGETLEIPRTLEGVIIARIDRLEPEWREVLTDASVLGRTFGMGLLQAVTELSTQALRQSVHHLLRLDLLREEGGGEPTYRYKHALIQEAAYHTLVGTKRAALHRRAAEWYENYYADRLERVYGLIAHHWLGTDDHEKAAHFLELAGGRALAEWALDEAVGHYRALVPLLEAGGRRQEAAETLFQLATTLHLAMRYREANETWQRALPQWTRPSRHAGPPTAGLRIASHVLPWDIDPAHGFHTANLMVHQQLYRRLVQGRPGPYVVPDLAVSWEVSDDGRRYRFTLDPRARFNDGGQITAPELVKGFQRLLDPASESTETAHFSPVVNSDAYTAGEITDFDRVGIHAIDDATLEFELRAPAPYFIFLLAYPGQSGAGQGRTSGPFRRSRLDADDVVIERDPRHQDSGLGGNVATVEFVLHPMHESEARLLRGEVDMVYPINPTPAAVQAIARGQLISAAGAPLMTTYLHFSGDPAFATDTHFRKALAHATDRRILAQILSSNQIPAHGGLVPPGVPGHTPDIALPFDPELARQYLRQSSTRGPIILAMLMAFPVRIWAPLVDSWKSTLDLELQTVEVDVRDVDRVSSMAHGSLGVWMAGYPDPGYFLHMLLHSRSSSNTSRWSSPAFDALVDRALAQDLSAARLALFHEADRLAIQNECAVIPLYYTHVTALLQPWVHGWWTWAVPWQTFDELTVDERSPHFNGLDTKGKSNP